MIPLMYFEDRKEAGQMLAHALKKYRNKEIVVYGLPRGGVIIAFEIAKYLNAPLDIIIARKIGHPVRPEYAIAAVAENGDIIEEMGEVELVDKVWFRERIQQERSEAKRRRELYLRGREPIYAKDKIAILVDDGVATGLTLRVGISELKHREVRKIVLALPVIPKETYSFLKKEVDDIIALEIPDESQFLGAVGAYYRDFPQVTDKEVKSALE